MSTDNQPPVKDKTTVHIEKTDESWALELLNESHSEDNVSSVHKIINQEPHSLGVICNNDKREPAESELDTPITVNEAELDETTLRLSAIENQIFTHSQKKYQTKDTEKKGLLVTPLSKIRSFFAA